MAREYGELGTRELWQKRRDLGKGARAQQMKLGNLLLAVLEMLGSLLFNLRRGWGCSCIKSAHSCSQICTENPSMLQNLLIIPHIFVTSSFDRDVKMWDLRQKPHFSCYKASSSRGNVMVCFSPDDQYLLVSAVDNEVKQLSAADGRLHLNFEIASTGSAHNYTRSYYLNGKDYIISGSCDEHVFRVCCAQTGRRLRDVYLEDSKSGTPMFVQSLRGDPFRDFHMSILATSTRPTSKREIIKVNLLASSSHYDDE